MTEALPPLAEIELPDHRIVTASAGSGKTTTLIRRLLGILLSDRFPHHDARHILAITFTNNAAAEMKERLLGALKDVALAKRDPVLEFSRITGIDPADLPLRAERLLDSILASYSELQVRTIDSFLAEIFRSAAVDFGFPPDYSVALSANSLLDRAFREFAVRAAADEKGLALLRELAALQDEQRSENDPYLWDPYGAIAARVRDLYRETARLVDPVVVPDLRELQRSREADVQTAAEALRDFLQSCGAPPLSNVLKDLDDARSGRIGAVLSRTVKKKALKSGTTKAEKAAVIAHEEAANALLDAFNIALNAYGILQVRRAYIPYARTLQLLRETLEDIKRREGTVLLDDINRTLAAYLSDDAFPDVYIRLGDQLWHHLVDEFQDTSPIQYAALFPLWQNALSSGGSVFVVGDTKQSIYGFRGADYRIMRTMIREEVFPSAPRRVATLEKNYRSRTAIIRFNAALFRRELPQSELRGPSEASGLSTDVQEPGLVDALPGRVRVLPVLRGAKEGEEYSTVADVVQGWKTQGYGWRDIAILTRANADVVAIASWLNARGIPFVSQSSLDIRNRKVVAELLALLRFLDSPVDDAAFAAVLLGELFARSGAGIPRTEIRELLARRAETGREMPLYTFFRAERKDVWDRCFEALFARVGYLPLYDLVSDVLRTFRVFERFPDEEASLARLLETVRETEATGENSVGDFLRSAESGDEAVSWELPAPRGHDAVTVMTVHKAKGLGFPAVCVLQFPWSTRVSQPRPVHTENGVELWRVTKAEAERHPELAEIFTEARERAEVDELNRMYVALTRAKVELAIVSAYEDPGDLPHRLFLAAAEEPGPEPPAEPDAPEAERDAKIWQDSSGLKPAGERDELLSLRERRRGTAIHAVLARISVIDGDAGPALAAAVEASKPQEEGLPWKDVEERLRAFLGLDEVRALFAPREGRVVSTELDVVARDGRLFRVDRTIVDNDTLTVVDFKTGRRDLEDRYREQVNRYLDLMSELYPGRRRRGLLAYVDLGLIVEVA